ncbi:unnamed protein product [Phaeothamnion confervicola]
MLSFTRPSRRASTGNYHTWNPFGGDVSLGDAGADLAKALVCMVLAGPFLTGYTQTINDWYDREIDAINEPYRPIPSGAISEGEVIAQIWVLLLGGLGLAYGLDAWAGHDFPVILALSAFGSFISYIYSAPPLKLKQNGWIGNYALGSSYISLPVVFFSEAVLFLDNSRQNCMNRSKGEEILWRGRVTAFYSVRRLMVVILTLLYSWAGLGIAIVNDFKSVEGDRELGLQSLPVAFGTETAKWICVASIDVTQLGIAAWLFSVGEPTYGAILTALILPQVWVSLCAFVFFPQLQLLPWRFTLYCRLLVFGAQRSSFRPELCAGDHICRLSVSRTASGLASCVGVPAFLTKKGRRG